MPKTATARVLTIDPKPARRRRSNGRTGVQFDVHAHREVEVDGLFALVQYHSQERRGERTLYIEFESEMEIDDDHNVSNCSIVEGGSIEVKGIEAVERLAQAMLEAARIWRAQGFAAPWPGAAAS